MVFTAGGMGAGTCGVCLLNVVTMASRRCLHCAAVTMNSLHFGFLLQLDVDGCIPCLRESALFDNSVTGFQALEFINIVYVC